MSLLPAGKIAQVGTALLVAACAVAPGIANINLELRPLTEPCASRYLWVDLYAVSDSAENQSISAMDVILQWDPSVLELTGIAQVGQYPYNWLFSGFPNDYMLDGINVTWADGDAFYEALSQLGNAAWATPSGLRVVTFSFRKLRVGQPTVISIIPGGPPQYQYTRTVIYSGQVPGLNVTGTLTGAQVIPVPTGDMNCDGLWNAFDIDPFVLALTDPIGYGQAYPDCDYRHADINCDGSVNAFDIDPFVALLTGS